MRITQEADYAIRIVLFLCKSKKEKFEAKIIAEHTSTPLRFTLKIMRKLTQGGITRSFRGIGGGYTLNMEPDSVSLKDVIELIDGPLAINRCLVSRDLCNFSAKADCAVHDALAEAQGLLAQRLDEIKFISLIT